MKPKQSFPMTIISLTIIDLHAREWRLKQVGVCHRTTRLTFCLEAEWASVGVSINQWSSSFGAVLWGVR
jgi:hypothetical protein